MIDSGFEESFQQHAFWITGIGAVKTLALLSYVHTASVRAMLTTQQTPQTAARSTALP